MFVPDMRVSRQHARIVRDGESWQLVDLGSNNGTYVNSARVEGTRKLEHDDEIQNANNRIRVEAKATTGSLAPGDVKPRVTLAPTAGASAVIKSRTDAEGARQALRTSAMTSLADQRELRLTERKLEALTQTVDALLAKLAKALLELFPQAQHVGVLVFDERSGKLAVKEQSQRAGVAAKDLEFVVPETIISHISHIVSDQRGVLLGDHTVDSEHIGTRMGAPLSCTRATCSSW